MEAVFIEAWRLIPQSYPNTCWKSLLKRTEAVQKAEGWYTKY
jgi:hypothetical protein